MEKIGPTETCSAENSNGYTKTTIRCTEGSQKRDNARVCDECSGALYNGVGYFDFQKLCNP